MAESSARKIRCMEEDRISKLPQEIRDIILCLLPIQDAVRTSVLSKKWRYHWTTIPHLIFNDEFSMRHRSRQYGDEKENALKFVSAINKVLLLHNGPILKFSLMLPRGEIYDAEIVNEFIDQWILLFSRKGIKQLTIEEDDELGEFTEHSLSSLNLTHLRFTHAHLRFTPAFGGFTNLINLQLVLVTSTLRRSFFDCPALEKLTLIICRGILPIDFHAPNLKCLHQVYREDDITLEDALDGLEKLTEYSCNLQSYPETHTETHNLVDVLGNLRKIEKFSAGMDFLMYLAARGCPPRLSKPLSYLKTLKICEVNFADLPKVSCLLCLIRSAPYLRELHIMHYEDYVEEDLKDYWIEDSEDCTVDHLEIVTFSNFKGLQAELELVKFLLGHAPLLKTMSIHSSTNIKKDTMAEVMLQHSRASSGAQIRQLEHPIRIDEFEFELWNIF